MHTAHRRKKEVKRYVAWREIGGMEEQYVR